MCHPVELSPLHSPLPVCMCYMAGPCLSSYSPWDPQPPSTFLLLTSSVLYVHNELRGHEPRKQVNEEAVVCIILQKVSSLYKRIFLQSSIE